MLYLERLGETKNHLDRERKYKNKPNQEGKTDHICFIAVKSCSNYCSSGARTANLVVLTAFEQ